MIERYVFVRLKPEYAADRAEIATHAQRALSALTDPVDVRVGTPSDEHADKAWDLSFAVRFESLEAVERYRLDPAHRQFVDEYLTPRTNVIKAWNFCV